MKRGNPRSYLNCAKMTYREPNGLLNFGSS